MSLLSNDYNFVILDSCDLWCFFKITVNNIKIIVCSLYFSPCKCIDTILEMFQTAINEIKTKELNSYDILLVGGDANCRVGISDDAPPELFDNSNLFATRKSLDKTLNPRGKKILQFMYENGFVLLNGRSFNDCPGNWTSSSKNGTSIVDLAWCDSLCTHFIHDFKVLQNKSGSDHFPIIVTLTVEKVTCDISESMPVKYNNNALKYKWNPNLEDMFASKMNALLSSDFDFETNFNSVDDSNDFLISSIKSVALDCYMEKHCSFNRKPVNNFNFKWFDQECKEAKKNVKAHLKVVRVWLFQR